MAGGEDPSDGGGLVQKVWVLRVSIHCEGCKKKIRKILTKVHGVSDVAIDAPQKTVTVTGVVEGDALVQRLAKFNKYAVLLPESKPAASSNADAATDRPKEVAKPKETQEPASEEKPAAAAKNADAGSAPAAEPAQANVKAEKKADKKAAAPEAAPPASAKDHEGAAAAKSRDLGDMYPYPVPQMQPNYVMSYNMAQPSASHAYYAPAVPTATQGHAYYAPAAATQGYGAYYPQPMQGYGAYYPQPQWQYPQPQHASPPPEFYYGSGDGGSSWSSSSSQQPAHSYDTLFSEENPNGCSIM